MNNYNSEKKITFVDLFAGIGGIRKGFEFPYTECVFSSEIDKFAKKTYEANFNETPCGDITQIDPYDIPDFNILLAGFPCQPFSQAGLKMGFDDSRGNLFFDIVRILECKKPSVVFLENVRNLATHNNGETLKIIIKNLEALNYKVFYQILNARDFGVPQNRARIYIIGFLDDVNFTFPEHLKKETRLGDILEKTVNEKYTISDKLWSGHLRRKMEHKKNGNGFGYSLFDENSKYTSTISARYYKDGSEILIKQEDRNPRKITPREAARLQGFPDDFIIPVNDSQAYRQFGNSVAIPVIKSLAIKIMEAIRLEVINIRKI